jgi:hypothetical protein
MALSNIELTTITSVFAGVTLLTLVLGYVRALFDRSGAVFHLVASIILVFGSYVMRTVYWDIAWLQNQTISTTVGINVYFDLIVLWGGFHGHFAIYKMIPEHDRNKYTVFTAWLYPPFILSGPVGGFVRWIREKFKDV